MARCAAIVRETLQVIDLDGQQLPPMPVAITSGATWGTMQTMSPLPAALDYVAREKYGLHVEDP